MFKIICTTENKSFYNFSFEGVGVIWNNFYQQRKKYNPYEHLSS